MSNYIPAYVFKQAARRAARRALPKRPSVIQQLEAGLISHEEARRMLYPELPLECPPLDITQFEGNLQVGDKVIYADGTQGKIVG